MFLFYSSLIYKDLLSFPRWAEIKDAENVEAFLLFVRNLIVQSRHSGNTVVLYIVVFIMWWMFKKNLHID